MACAFPNAMSSALSASPTIMGAAGDLKTQIVGVLTKAGIALDADMIRALIAANYQVSTDRAKVNAVLYKHRSEFVEVGKGGKMGITPLWGLAPKKAEPGPVMKMAGRDGEIEIAFHGRAALPENVGKAAIELVMLNPSVAWKFADTESGVIAAAAVAEMARQAVNASAEHQR